MLKKSVKIRCEIHTTFNHRPSFGHPLNIRVLDISNSKYITFAKGVLSSYENLEVLALRNCNLKSFPDEIFYLNNLKKLFLGGNDIDIIPKEIKNLHLLEELQISHNKIESVPDEITSLNNLKNLWLNGNRVKEIPASFGKFNSLQKLFISHNLCEKIPQELLALSSLTGLYINNNPLHTIPIYDFRGNSLDKLKLYYKSISSGYEKSYEAKIVLLGDGAVGKTTLVKQLMKKKDRLHIISDQVILGDTKETKGVEVKEWIPIRIKENEREYDLSIKIWDFGGQEIQSEVHHLFLSHETLYLLLWANRVVNDKNRYLKTWLNKIESYGGLESKVIVVQTMYGEKDTSYSNVDRKTLSELYSPLIVGFSNVSSMDEIGLHNRGGLKDTVINQTLKLPQVGKDISINWIEIKNDLRELRRYKHILELTDFIDICSKKSIKRNESKLLLNWLHNIGHILYYEKPKEVSRHIFLDPNWVTNIFYKIILDDKKIIHKKGGVFSLEDIEEYVSIREEIIIDLMSKFDLCFKVDEVNDVYILPALLPLNVNEKDFSFLNNYQVLTKYVVVFTVVPNSFLSRVISKSYKDGLVYMDYYWKDGVVLKLKQSFVKISKSKMSKNINNEILVEIYGEDRWYAFERVREIFSPLLTDLKGCKEVISCSSGVQCKKSSKYYFNLLTIEKAQKSGIDRLQCGECFKEVRVDNLIPRIGENESFAPEEIKKLIIQGKVKRVFDVIRESSIDKLQKDEVQLIQSRFSLLEKQRMEGTINNDTYVANMTKINSALLNVITSNEKG